MAFRDSFDQCPRCGTTLEDAGAARGCRSCAGMFVEPPVLSEMILRMLPPPPRAFGPLLLSEVKREETALPCPSCGDPMKPTVIHDIELDHCPKHGVWFDQDELRLTLYRVAERDEAPPFGEWLKPPEPWERPRKPPPMPKTDPGVRGLAWDVGGRSVVTQTGVVKIGRAASSGIQIDDPSVARMHAIVEVTPTGILVIDLGSEAGTLLNGTRVVKAALEPGDVLRIGNIDVTLVAT